MQNGALLFLIGLIGVVSLACNSLAQKPEPAVSPLSSQEAFKIISKNESKDGEVVTIISLERMAIVDPDVGGPIGFSSMFAYDEKSRAEPAAYISFYSSGSKCRFPSNSELIFVADGRVIHIANEPATANLMAGKLISLSEPGVGKCKESLDILLAKSVYFSIANAEIGDVQFGELKFRLNANHLNALRELTRRMTALKP